MPMCTLPYMSQKGSGCNPNRNPNHVHKELSTLTYQDCDTKGMVHNRRVTYRTVYHLGYVTQRADPLEFGGWRDVGRGREAMPITTQHHQKVSALKIFRKKHEIIRNGDLLIY